MPESWPIDRRGLRKLLRAHAPRLTRRINRRLPAANRVQADAEDILQEVLIAAFLRLEHGNWDSLQGFERWLAVVTTTQTNVWLRRLNRMKRGGGRPAAVREDVPEAMLASPAPTPSRVAASAEMAEVIRAAIQTLPPLRSRIVSMRYIEGRSVQEIAQACSLSTSAVSHHLQRAMPQLRRQLGDAGQFFTHAASAEEAANFETES